MHLYKYQLYSKWLKTKWMSQSESLRALMIRLVGLSLRLPKLCSGQSCMGQRLQKNNGLKKRVITLTKLHKWLLSIMCNTLSPFLDTFANMPFNNAFDFVEDLVISSAVVIGPPVECRCPIRGTEGWLTCFQGRGCYDIQWHDNTAEWKARQYVVQALVNQTHLLWTSNWLTSLNCA